MTFLKKPSKGRVTVIPSNLILCRPGYQRECISKGTTESKRGGGDKSRRNKKSREYLKLPKKTKKERKKTNGRREKREMGILFGGSGFGVTVGRPKKAGKKRINLLENDCQKKIQQIREKGKGGKCWDPGQRKRGHRDRERKGSVIRLPA